MSIVDQINKLTGGHATTIADAINYATKKKGDTIEEAVKNVNFSGGGDDWGILRQFNNGTPVNLVVPDDITDYHSPLSGNAYIVSVEMPEVQTIDGYAFAYSEQLASVEMPNVTSIGDCAFQECYSLASMEMPNVTSIGGSAFWSCSSLASVEMPNVTSIGAGAFDGCSSLASVIIDNTTPPSVGSNVFGDTHSDLKIYVPASAVDTYKSATGWSDYADKIVAIGS